MSARLAAVRALASSVHTHFAIVVDGLNSSSPVDDDKSVAHRTGELGTAATAPAHASLSLPSCDAIVPASWSPIPGGMRSAHGVNSDPPSGSVVPSFLTSMYFRSLLRDERSKRYDMTIEAANNGAKMRVMVNAQEPKRSPRSIA
eukprot:6167150-Prymnesium_polylepis.1